MSKIGADVLSAAVDQILAFSRGDKSATVPAVVDKVTNKVITPAKKPVKRGFVETIELQVSLKNYDVNKDKRFTGVFRLPIAPRPRLSVCILGSEEHLAKAKEVKGLDAMVRIRLLCGEG